MAITDEQPQPGTSLELLARARAGDALAFCQLLEPLQTRLLRQGIALNGDVSLAEDIVSETRVRAWKHLSRYNESCRLSTWLYAILLHCHQEAARRARSRPASIARLPFSEARELHKQHESNSSAEPSPAEAAAQKETVIELNRCIEMLPEKHRDIIRLRFFEDASLPDMAVILGCSLGTVKSRLHHALEKLRRMKIKLQYRKGHSQL